MSILSPCCCGYSSSNRGEDQADSSSHKRTIVRVPRLAFRTWVARPPKASFCFLLSQSLISPLPLSQHFSFSLVPPSTLNHQPSTSLQWQSSAAAKSCHCHPLGSRGRHESAKSEGRHRHEARRHCELLQARG